MILGPEWRLVRMQSGVVSFGFRAFGGASKMVGSEAEFFVANALSHCQIVQGKLRYCNSRPQ